jgi:hypothetical protein
MKTLEPFKEPFAIETTVYIQCSVVQCNAQRWDNSLSEQPFNGKALHRAVPFDRFFDLALVLQHLKELTTL